MRPLSIWNSTATQKLCTKSEWRWSILQTYYKRKINCRIFALSKNDWGFTLSTDNFKRQNTNATNRYNTFACKGSWVTDNLFASNGVNITPNCHYLPAKTKQTFLSATVFFSSRQEPNALRTWNHFWNKTHLMQILIASSVQQSAPLSLD